MGAGVELTVFVKVSTSDGRLTAREGADSVHPQAITPNSSSTMPTQSLILSISLHPVTSCPVHITHLLLSVWWVRPTALVISHRLCLG
jgi:hypothetical protein